MMMSAIWNGAKYRKNREIEDESGRNVGEFN